MRKFRFLVDNSLAVAILVSVLALLLLWLISPLQPTLATPQAKVFDEVWQTVNNNFYDPKFNGVDWKAMGEKYKTQIVRAKSSQQFASIINQMLAELRTSHTYLYTPNEQEYYQLLGIFQANNIDFQQRLKKLLPNIDEYSGIGVFTEEINGNTFVSGILDGSPAATTGLKVGDQLLSLDDRPYQPIQSFAGKAGQKVKLLIQRTPNPKSRQEITVMPKMLHTTKMFWDAQKASTQVIDRQGKKVGYVHIWSYAGDKYQEMLEEDLLYGSLKDADGLVLDLRDGWGGASPNYLNIFTASGPSVTYIGRYGMPHRSSYQWKKPVVMVVNQGTRSGKEILAFGFQKYKIGPVVGSKTAGAVVGGSPFLMQDGSLLYLATVGLLINDKYRLEGKGVTPDINVPFLLEYAQGTDPQKERAIEAVLEVLKAANAS